MNIPKYVQKLTFVKVLMYSMHMHTLRGRSFHKVICFINDISLVSHKCIVINHQKGLLSRCHLVGYGGLMTHTCGTNVVIEQVSTRMHKLSHEDDYEKGNER